MKIYCLLLLIVTIMLSSCQTYRVETLGYKDEVKKFKSIAVLNTYIFPRKADRLPAISKHPLSTKDSVIKSQIYQFNIEQTDTVADFFTSKLREYSGIEVLSGKELYSKLTPEVLDSLGIKQYPTDLWPGSYPTLGLPKYTLQLIDLSKYYYPHLTFLNETIKNHKNDFVKICDFLKVDGLVISEMHIEVNNQHSKLILGRQQMFSNIVFFDKNGNKLSRGYIESENVYDRVYDFEIYKEQFNKYYKYTDAYLRHFYLDEPYEQYLDD